jgi:hypothetical protein
MCVEPAFQVKTKKGAYTWPGTSLEWIRLTNDTLTIRIVEHLIIGTAIFALRLAVRVW